MKLLIEKTENKNKPLKRLIRESLEMANDEFSERIDDYLQFEETFLGILNSYLTERAKIISNQPMPDENILKNDIVGDYILETIDIITTLEKQCMKYISL